MTDEKVMQKIIDLHTMHLKGEEFVTRQQQLMSSYDCQHERPPQIITNNYELKLYLLDLAKEFGITGDIELDQGNSFTYQIYCFYPTYF